MAQLCFQIEDSFKFGTCASLASLKESIFVLFEGGSEDSRKS